MSDFIPCTLRQLPATDLLAAAQTAIFANPANRAPVEKLSRLIENLVITPQHIALLTTKYWGTGGVDLGVAFLDTDDTTLKSMILQHMNAWGNFAAVRFREAAAGGAQVRIARQQGGGYWSYLGTDILHIPGDQPTMNLDSFSTGTPESEYRRVVRHETGHTLGFPHEHMRREIVQRLNPQATIAYFMETQGWSPQEIEQQVLTPLDDAQLTAAPADVDSIMCYQLPAEITTDGQPIPGGIDIDPEDGAFAAKIYPKQAPPPPPPPPPVLGKVTFSFDWDGQAPTFSGAAVKGP